MFSTFTRFAAIALLATTATWAEDALPPAAKDFVGTFAGTVTEKAPGQGINLAIKTATKADGTAVAELAGQTILVWFHYDHQNEEGKWRPNEAQLAWVKGLKKGAEVSVEVKYTAKPAPGRIIIAKVP